MRYYLVLLLTACILSALTVSAQAGMKEFCAKRWHNNGAMQDYCLEIQEQSTMRLAKLLDILDATHDRMIAAGSYPETEIAQQCSDRHHLKVFDAYHNQLVESCIIQYLDRLEQPVAVYQHQVLHDDY